MSEYIFFNIWDGHFKMWGYDTYKDNNTDEWKLVTYWGKIRDGLSKLQTKEKIFKDNWGCLDYIREKIDDKLRKGYVRLENKVYSRYSCGEITLSELVKEIEGNKPITWRDI